MLAKGQLLSLSKIDLRAATQPFTLPPCKGEGGQAFLVSARICGPGEVFEGHADNHSETVAQSILLVKHQFSLLENGDTNDFVGEGSGNPLQYSCLANPMDGGAW